MFCAVLKRQQRFCYITFYQRCVKRYKTAVSNEHCQAKALGILTRKVPSPLGKLFKGHLTHGNLQNQSKSYT